MSNVFYLNLFPFDDKYIFRKEKKMEYKLQDYGNSTTYGVFVNSA